MCIRDSNEDSAISLENGEVLFSLTFAAKASATLSDVISVSSRYTAAEAYDNEGSLLDVAFGFNTINGTIIASGEYELLQNKPNPFKESTLIGFNLPEATQATLSIFDVSGKTLKVINGDFARGYNEVTINREDLGSVGVLFYQLETQGFSGTKKMILLD